LRVDQPRKYNNDVARETTWAAIIVWNELIMRWHLLKEKKDGNTFCSATPYR
jgi:hypothetical protein